MNERLYKQHGRSMTDLRQTLAGVLADLSPGPPSNSTRMVTPPAFRMPNATLAPGNFFPSLSLAQGGGANQHAELLSALQQRQQQQQSAWSGMNSRDLLLSSGCGAADRRLIDNHHQSAVSALQQHVSSYSFPNSYHNNSTNSLLGMYSGNVPSGSSFSLNSAIGLTGFGLPSPEQPPKIPGALEVLGKSLRQTNAPYIDVSDAHDPDPRDETVKKTRGGVTEPFPERLHRLLKEIADDGNGDVISFYAHGRAFGIHNTEKFVSEIMPKYFKHNQLSSFQRQVSTLELPVCKRL